MEIVDREERGSNALRATSYAVPPLLTRPQHFVVNTIISNFKTLWIDLVFISKSQFLMVIKHIQTWTSCLVSLVNRVAGPTIR